MRTAQRASHPVCHRPALACNMDVLNTSTFDIATSHCSSDHVPTELLHSIIAIACAEYIDELIMERPLEISLVGGTPSPDPLEENPVVSLLQVSSQVREITLDILSRGMGILRQQDGRYVLFSHLASYSATSASSLIPAIG